MQTAHSTRRIDHGQIRHIVVAAAMLASFAIGLIALAATDRLPMIDGAESPAVSMPQVTSDELYALEAELAASQVNGWNAAITRMTSDEAWALEASMKATAEAHRHAQMMLLTPDEAWAIEQAQLLVGSEEQRGRR